MIRQVPMRTRLLRTVSAAALMLLITQTPPAKADAQKSPFQIILELYGGVPSGDRQVWSDPCPCGPLTIKPNFHAGGVVGVVGSMSHFLPGSHAGWGFGMFARFGTSNNASEGRVTYYHYNVLGGNYPSYYTAGRARHRETHAIVDFEARRDVGLGGDGSTRMTLKAGVRFAHFGPRIGAEVALPLAYGFTLDLAASASVLFGQQSTSVNAVGGLAGISAVDRRRFAKTVALLDGEAAVSYVFPTSMAKVSIGTKVDAWLNVHDTRTKDYIPGFPLDPVFGKRNASRFWVSPFVRVTVPIGG
jgi:hypothetical protein